MCYFSQFFSGFRQKCSCQSILLRMIEEWKSANDNGNLVGAIAIDLSKAFYSLPHGLLIARLAACGIDLPSCTLTSCCLLNRHQRVKFNSTTRVCNPISKFVPRGSVLLFNICINSILFQWTPFQLWVSYQMRKIADCACAGNAGNVFPTTDFKGNRVTHVLWCMSGSLTRGGWENVPSISGACATRNFMYLVRVPCWSQLPFYAGNRVELIERTLTFYIETLPR